VNLNYDVGLALGDIILIFKAIRCGGGEQTEIVDVLAIG
jgi:hypothetical protein